jgi:short-subunit dehydrogenase
MKLTRDSVCVVTGAGGGIGRALALALAREGSSLALADINAEKLAGTAADAKTDGAGRVTTHAVDVADLAAMTGFRDAVNEAHGGVHLLVNNAGVALDGELDEVSVEDMRWLFEINFWGTVYGTRLFLPLMRQQREAQIVNIASIFGIMAVAGQTAYAASKFAVRGFSDALRHELGGSRITVTTVYPSGVRTDVARSARVPAKFDRTRAAAMIAGFDKLAQTTPEQAAARIVRGVKRGEQRILVGNGAKLMAAIAWLVPVRYWRIVDRPLAPMALRKPGGR